MRCTGHEGTVNRIMGDGIMALFGAPLAQEGHAVRACYAALAITDQIRRWSDDQPPREGSRGKCASASTRARS
jgi:class 3 adenylate cyclase